MDTNKIDKINIDLITPTTDSNQLESQRDRWGNILNEQTFKTLNNNMKIMKEILLEIANENNVTNLDSIKLRLNNLETDRDSIESIVDNNTNGLINVGIIERKLNLKGTELEFNSNKVDLDNVAYTNRENTFSENINNTKVYKLKGGTVLENIDNKIKIGNISNKLDLQTTDGTFLVNGEEFRLSSEEVKALLDTTDFQATETINGTSKIATQTEVDNGLENTKIVTSKKLKARLDTLLAGITSTYVLKTDNATETVAGITKIATQSEINAGTDDSKLVTSKKLASMLNSKLSTYIKNTDVATETKAGIITEARIKEIAPKPDLTPYVPFSKGFRNQNDTDWFVRTNGRITWASDVFEMWNGDNNQFMGAFHTNSYNSFYKVPNRNGGNWNRLIDEHDLLDVMIRNQWKVIFDGVFGVQGGVVASLPNDWSDCLVYFRVYSAAGNLMDNSSMLITSSEKGGRYMVYYSGGGNHEIKINVNAINQVVLADRYGDAVINKVLYKNNR